MEGSKLLEESTEKSCYGTISNAGPSTEERKSKIPNPDLTSSAPEVLEPSKYASPPKKPRKQGTLEGSDSPPINPWRTLVTCSLPDPSIRVQINSDDQTNGHEDRQIIDEEAMDPQSTKCSILINFYKNAAIKLRNSFFIHIFQVLFSFIPLSAIVMGVLFDDKCMEFELLPAYGGMVGVIGLLVTGLWIYISYCHRFDRSIPDTINILFASFLMVLLLSELVDMSIFGVMAYNYNEVSTNCSRTFYCYAFYKQIATGAFAILAGLLYLPGSLRFLHSL